MNTVLLAQDHLLNTVVLCNSNSRTAAKHAAACEKARKAYLRSIYGKQPGQGKHVGWIDSIVVEGSVVIAEIDFLWGTPCVGMIELPLHALKMNGIAISTTKAVESLVGHKVYVIVANRYAFDGIYLSNVTDVQFEIESKQVNADLVQFKVAQV